VPGARCQDILRRPEPRSPNGRPLPAKGARMLLIREIMYCKPGKVRPMVEKFKAMAKIMEKNNQGTMKIMTDMAAERYWTIVSEFEVESMDAFDKMMSGEDQTSAEDMKQMEEIMKNYHDLVEYGRREIYKVEY
jgi:hypothetical protein